MHFYLLTTSMEPKHNAWQMSKTELVSPERKKSMVLSLWRRAFILGGVLFATAAL